MSCRWSRGELEAEIILQGGNPDRLDDCRADDYCDNGLDVFDVAEAECCRQARQDTRVCEERAEQERLEDEERRYYEDMMRAEREAEERQMEKLNEGKSRSTMSPKEFMDLGLLQEINRQFLHPRGLAMAVMIDGEEVTLGPIYDYRAEPEGVEFARGDIDLDKVERVRILKEERYGARAKLPEMGIDGIQKLDSEWSPEEVE